MCDTSELEWSPLHGELYTLMGGQSPYQESMIKMGGGDHCWIGVVCIHIWLAVTTYYKYEGLIVCAYQRTSHWTQGIILSVAFICYSVGGVGPVLHLWIGGQPELMGGGWGGSLLDDGSRMHTHISSMVEGETRDT